MRAIFVRAETFQNEYRAPLVPEHVSILIKKGIQVYIESSQTRFFSDRLYSDISGCIVTKQPWNAPEFQNALILGIKELKNLFDLSGHTHLYFSHALKGQTGSQHILNAFLTSKSQLYDFEYFTDASGVRLIAFGWYAGIVGAALGLQEYSLRGKNSSLQRLYPWPSFTSLLASIPAVGQPRIAVVGAKGRCGQGVCKVLDALHLIYTAFYRESQIPDLTTYDIVYNCILLDEGYKSIWFSSTTVVAKPLIIVDISCDYSKKNNPIGLYSQATTWEQPVIQPLSNLSLIAIENLPSLLPQESSYHFSECLIDLLQQFQQGQIEVWNRAFQRYQNLSKEGQRSPLYLTHASTTI